MILVSPTLLWTPQTPNSEFLIFSLSPKAQLECPYIFESFDPINNTFLIHSKNNKLKNLSLLINFRERENRNIERERDNPKTPNGRKRKTQVENFISPL